MTIRRIALIFLLLLTGFDGFAQDRIRVHAPGDLIYSGVGVSLFTFGSYSYSHKKDWPPQEFQLPDFHSINSFDRPAVFRNSHSAEKWSDVLLTSSLILPAVLATDKNIRRDAGPVAAVYFQTMVITVGEIQLVKGNVHRLRPYVYNPDVPISKKMKPDAGASFFSGHTALTAAMLSFTAITYSIYHPHSSSEPWIWTACMSLPLTTGYLRYRAGMHFPTDVLAGLVIGVANGFLITKIHESK